MERLHAHRAQKIDFIEDDLLASNLPPESADFVISTFGLKTFNAEQHARLANLLARVLKPGGVFSMIEASDPKGWWLRPLYLFHLKVLLPIIESAFHVPTRVQFDRPNPGPYSQTAAPYLEWSTESEPFPLAEIIEAWGAGTGTTSDAVSPATGEPDTGLQ
jgi:SAM-dependent methyltransferase